MDFHIVFVEDDYSVRLPLLVATGKSLAKSNCNLYANAVQRISDRVFGVDDKRVLCLDLVLDQNSHKWHDNTASPRQFDLSAAYDSSLRVKTEENIKNSFLYFLYLRLHTDKRVIETRASLARKILHRAA